VRTSLHNQLKFIPLLPAEQLPVGARKVVQMGAYEVALFNIEGCIYAIDNTCPHQGAPLIEGWVAGGCVTCPWHAWTFELATGNMTLGEYATIDTFEVQTEEGMICVSGPRSIAVMNESHHSEPAWDGIAGTAGGAAFAAALSEAAREAGLEDACSLAAAADLDFLFVQNLLRGTGRATTVQLARLASALRLRAVEFMQKTNLLSLEVYALGLDPLYFLAPGQVRHDARIYMREINPRHRVPERDMLTRNPTLKALMADELLDSLGKLEVELSYLLRAAIQQTGGTL
jgi:nitrite reductase (NADH) small subunit